MTVGLCAVRIFFVHLETNSPKFFGFSDFLASLALMVLVWTIADVRYRFRIRCAPIPLQAITFTTVVAVGVLTLLTDLWRAQGWLVPKVNFFTPASWQALLAGLYLLTFLVWVVFAFIKPATFSRWNAKRYARSLFGVIVKGSTSELAVVADEVARSAKSLVAYAPERVKFPHALPDALGAPKKLSKTGAFANDILSLIADKRFCRAVVGSSPGTIWAFFLEMATTKRYRIQIETFANNVVNEAIDNRDSFLYHETAGYESGLLGHYKPICEAMFSNFEMVEAIETVLDTDYRSRSNWDSDQWEAYFRASLMTLRGYMDKNENNHSYVLHRVFADAKEAVADLYKLKGTTGTTWEKEPLDRLRVVVRFITEAVQILDKKDVPAFRRKRSKQRDPYHRRDIYDQIADLAYEIVSAAAAVNSPRDLCWWVQHNALWSELFNFEHLNGRAGRLVKAEVCRLILQDVLAMNRTPNFKGAKILGFCLNVLGLQRGKEDYYKDSRALHRAILFWTKKNFARLHGLDPRLTEECLVDGVTYDGANNRIAKEYPRWPGRREPRFIYLNLDPLPVDTEKATQAILSSTKVKTSKRLRRRRKHQRKSDTSSSSKT